MRKPLLIAIATLITVSCSTQFPSSFETDASAIARQLDVSYQVNSNVGQVDCPSDANAGKCFSATMTYETGESGIPSRATIYFSHIAPIVSSSLDSIDIQHIQGDLHSLRFNDGISPNTRVSFEVLAPFWHAARSDVMPNQYLIIDDSTPQIIASTARETETGTGISYSAHAGSWALARQYKRHSDDELPLDTAETLYEQLPDTWSHVPEARVIPQVEKRQKTGQYRVFNGLSKAALSRHLDGYVVTQLEKAGLKLTNRGEAIELTVEPTRFDSPSSYVLSVSDSIRVVAATEAAAGYALITLSQLVDSQTNQIELTEISDSPRFEYRGVHLDIARHFLGEQAVDTVLEQMFQLKLNTLHLHLSDDEGWRVEIPALPELTEIGAYRCHDLSETHCILPQLGSGPHRDALGNGFLSVADYQRLLKKAAALGIEVIPSFDMPGHARAAVKAMEARYKKYFAKGQIEAAKAYLLSDPNDMSDYASVQFYNDNTMNPCMESSYHFVETVLKSLIRIHQDAGVKLNTYHLGADETAGAWVKSPICEALGEDPRDLRSKFVGRVVDIGNALGLTMAGWSDGMEDTLEYIASKQVQVNIWDTLYGNGATKTNEFVAHQIPTVLSFPDILYFDFPYRNHPNEPGYYWASKSTSTKRVFEFMPGNLPAHADIWKDRFGQDYLDNSPIAKTSGIAGIQAQLWTEVTPNQQHMEYMLFPRLLAFAERAWSHPKWQDEFGEKNWLSDRQSDWQSFATSLVAQQFPRLAKAGINFRVPPPGAKLEGNTLLMRTSLPGLILEFATDGNNWSEYEKPIHIESGVWVRSRVPNSELTSGYVRISK